MRIHAIARIHEISDRASETKSWERYSVNFHCMIRGDGNEMMSIYSGSAEYILPVTLSTSVTPVSPYNRRRSLKMYLIERV